MVNGITILRTCGGHENIRVIQKVIHNDELNQTIVIWRLFVVLFVDFKSLFNARFPSSLQTCQLRFQVQKLGANFATKFASVFQCFNYCKQMFTVQVEINNSIESSWSSRLPRRFVFH